jgi:uncharacterized protein (DUF1684 family)
MLEQDVSASAFLDLYDFRLQVAAMYRERNQALDEGADPAVVHAGFRARRDQLFSGHPQTALSPDKRSHFAGLDYFPYNPAMCVEGLIDTGGAPERREVATSGEEIMPMERVGRVRFTIAGADCVLTLYWIDVYGGGLFLPFVDATAPEETYGGGRYLIDTVKGSDIRILERTADAWRVELDFNYAYNPSCAYDYRWVCPLAPPESRLPMRIEAGEKKFTA